jgi:hypothetical protein
MGFPLERDLHFVPTRTIAAYADLAREHRRIVRQRAVSFSHRPSGGRSPRMSLGPADERPCEQGLSAHGDAQ